jgi:hypothetical protein
MRRTAPTSRKVPPTSQRVSGTEEWKRFGEHWPKNRTGLMESRRLCVKVTANPSPARQRHLLVVGKAASVLEQLYREDRFVCGPLITGGPARPRLNPSASRGRGGRARGDTQRQSRCYIAGSNTPLSRALYATIGSGPRPSPGPRCPGMAARGTRRLVTRKKPSSALSRSNASSRI